MPIALEESKLKDKTLFDLHKKKVMAVTPVHQYYRDLTMLRHT
jgi:hypothetical protein